MTGETDLDGRCEESIFDAAKKVIERKGFGGDGNFVDSSTYHAMHNKHSVFVKKDINDPQFRYVLIMDPKYNLVEKISYAEWKLKYSPDAPT